MQHIMTHATTLSAAILLSLLFGALPADRAHADDAPRELSWDDLVPASNAALAADAAAEAPAQSAVVSNDTVATLNGENIKLPGFVVPLDMSGERVTTFLLVPYFGACIHQPPPPPNQTIYVELDDAIDLETMYYPVWVSGILKPEATSSDLAEAGYTMAASKVERFEY